MSKYYSLDGVCTLMTLIPLLNIVLAVDSFGLSFVLFWGIILNKVLLSNMNFTSVKT